MDIYDEKQFDVESTSSTNTKNMWSSGITCKEGKIDSEDVGNAAETASSDDATLYFLLGVKNFL